MSRSLPSPTTGWRTAAAGAATMHPVPFCHYDTWCVTVGDFVFSFMSSKEPRKKARTHFIVCWFLLSLLSSVQYALSTYCANLFIDIDRSIACQTPWIFNRKHRRGRKHFPKAFSKSNKQKSYAHTSVLFLLSCQKTPNQKNMPEYTRKLLKPAHRTQHHHISKTV